MINQGDITSDDDQIEFHHLKNQPLMTEIAEDLSIGDDPQLLTPKQKARAYLLEHKRLSPRGKSRTHSSAYQDSGDPKRGRRSQVRGSHTFVNKLVRFRGWNI